MSIDDALPLLNGLAGVAALVNSALMWPVIRSLKHVGEDHGQRLQDHGERLEALEALPKSAKPIIPGAFRAR